MTIVSFFHGNYLYWWPCLFSLWYHELTSLLILCFSATEIPYMSYRSAGLSKKQFNSWWGVLDINTGQWNWCSWRQLWRNRQSILTKVIALKVNDNEVLVNGGTLVISINAIKSMLVTNMPIKWMLMKPIIIKINAGIF